MYYGCAWYPEHWPEKRWAEDLRLMRAAHLNVVRIAEFAWSRLEPREGRYDLAWLERAVNVAGKAGLAVVIGTPTAAPPAWLTQKYPDVLAVRESGRPESHGGRCHYSPTSPQYREFCRKIAAALAQRFGQNPHVIGWQIDNEYWSYSYDAHSLKRFQDWLRQRYGSLDVLNAAWSNAYWSEDYQDWSQIPAWHGWQNPCLLQAGKLFMTDVYREYQRIQFDAIRAHAEPRQWITHNCHAHPHLDWARIGRELDFVSWDPYLGGHHLDPVGFGPVLDFARGIQRKNVWVIETQPGFVNWDKINTCLDKGEVRRLVWHCIGHGADAVLFWQWRSALGGQEQYHGSLIAPDGTPRPLYAEAAQIGAELAQFAPCLAGTTVKAEVALLDSYPDRWALNGQRHHADYDPQAHLRSFYAPLRAAGLDVDLQQPGDDLSRYRLVIAPHLHILTPAIVQNLVAYVRGGGHLLLGPRSGFKDEHNALLPSRQPGKELAALLGAHVAEFYALKEPVPVTGGGTARIFAEYLVVDAADAKALLRFGQSNGWLDGQPAMVTRAVGKGRISYLGAWLDDRTMMKVLKLRPSPAGVEVSRRGPVTIVINHGRKTQTVAVTGKKRQVAAGDVMIL
jgi:beta-galactosidase